MHGNKVLDQVAKKFGHEIERKEILMGGASIDVHGVPLTDEAIATISGPIPSPGMHAICNFIELFLQYCAQL